MIDLSPIKDIFLFTGNTDFRKGILGLSGIVCVFRRNQATYLGECRPVISAIVGHFSELY